MLQMQFSIMTNSSLLSMELVIVICTRVLMKKLLQMGITEDKWIAGDNSSGNLAVHHSCC